MSEQSTQAPANPFKNIMAMFSPGQRPQVAPQASVAQPAQPAQQHHSPHTNQEPTNDPRPQEPAPTESPLAGLAGLWESNGEDGDKAANRPSAHDPIFQFNEEEFAKRVNSMNFVDPQAFESMQERLAQGDTSALMELVTMAARSAYTQAAKTGAAAAEHAAKVAMERTGSQVPELLTTELTRQELATQNKLFTDPALRPVAESIAQKYREKYPTASPQDIARYTQHYFQQVAANFAPTNPTQPAQDQPLEVDYSNFFGG